MDRLDLKFYADGQCAISTGNNLHEDREQEKADHGRGLVVSHVRYEPDSEAGETALESMMCTHDLELYALEPGESSTLLRMLSAAFYAGVEHGHGQKRPNLSDL